MKLQPGRLADGREITYFDESDDAVRNPLDRRELPPPPHPSELRFDPLTEEWVAIAGHRQSRTFLPPSSECPLCPSTEDRLTEIPADDYDVAIFENRFPSFATAADAGGFTVDETAYPVVRPGDGRCEVVCFTPDHDASFAALDEKRVRTVLSALAVRTAELSAMPGVEQVFCFENRGVEIGVTLHHPHGQIYAYPYVTPRTTQHLAAARRHRERTGRILYADVLAAERAAGIRVIESNEHWTSFVPAAARWPYEIHVAPHRQVPDVAALTEAERDACAPLWLSTLRRLDGLFGQPMPYIAAWHQAPVRIDRDLGYLHLQIFSIRRAPGKLKYLAGSESAMGAFVNDIAPEDSAAALRAAG
ncbi:UDPglucose--hexose-1-phosphate uridylyltransferase [Allocatelliglobosispora scoriae]|uniref:Galactose-1-phosphate uridylyltransferase n=1 Tax=Allocatelliglobosispora scoriae TaxID=643052 RepID=A0A841BXD9_9ACTN|nr:galactose-1-phosphate uridylyltransferase [Allocatelliglobosispora scoriae]MBB5871593.1 UDPglucose--hexose-1-phosphate uridylyltransferase [Allocatelliglobosispora scoriae]